MNLNLKKIQLQEIEFFQQKMVESFRSGVIDRFGNADAAPIPPEDDLFRCSRNENSDLWAIMLEEVPAGATVISKDAATGRYSLDLLLFSESSSISGLVSMHGSSLKQLIRMQRFGKLTLPILSGATSTFMLINAVSRLWNFSTNPTGKNMI